MPESSFPFFIVDAFSSGPFTGNQAAVCILEELKSDEWLQAVATEFNYSETAFLWHQSDKEHQGHNLWQLRWFTPACEVKLCGHATLASAHALLQEVGLKESELLFSTLSGTLSARAEADSITLELPKIHCEYLSKVHLHELGFDQLNINALDTYRAGEDFLIHLETEDEVKNYEPEVEKIARLAPRGLIITAASNNTERDFVSRFFAPAVGIVEDPVTGSAHCSLGAFWERQLGKNELRAAQLSKRGGTLKVKVNEASVNLTGNCFTFARGRFR